MENRHILKSVRQCECLPLWPADHIPFVHLHQICADKVSVQEMEYDPVLPSDANLISSEILYDGHP